MSRTDATLFRIPEIFFMCASLEANGAGIAASAFITFLSSRIRRFKIAYRAVD